MAVITIIGAGMMGSAMAFPACANKNTVRLVGTPLDRAIIEHGRKTQEHLTLTHDVNGKKTSFRMPDGVTFHDYEEFGECLKGADLLICGVSSFGLDWFCERGAGHPRGTAGALHHQGHDRQRGGEGQTHFLPRAYAEIHRQKTENQRRGRPLHELRTCRP